VDMKERKTFSLDFFCDFILKYWLWRQIYALKLCYILHAQFWIYKSRFYSIALLASVHIYTKLFSTCTRHSIYSEKKLVEYFF
jgi:hypothetical protein